MKRIELARTALAVVACWVGLTGCGGPSEETSGAGSPSGGEAGSGTGSGTGAGGGSTTGAGGASVSPTCGNAVTDAGEACDGGDLNGFGCTSIPGYASGALACKADCKGYDVSSCLAGATVHAASCNQDDVQSAIDRAQDGDTVVVPEGTCTWTKTVRVGCGEDGGKVPGKAVFIQGAGVDKTVVKDSVIPVASVPTPLLRVVLEEGKSVRISGFTFDGTGSAVSYGAIVLGGPYSTSMVARVDHNKFTNVTQKGVSIDTIYALIDHNTFVRIPEGYSPTLISLSGYGDDVGDGSWARPQDQGTANAVYIEDNTFIHNINANGPYDAYTGARYVFRNNDVYGNNLGHHGFDSANRGIVNFEIYRNHFTNASPEGAPYQHGLVFEIRSGSGLFFDNVAEKPPNATGDQGTYDAFAVLRNYRSDPAYIENVAGGPCDGTNVADGNSLDIDSDNDGVLDESSGYPCKDQIGRTSNQELWPVFGWNNDFQGVTGGNLVVGEHGDNTVTSTYHVLENRDYFNGGVTLDASKGTYNASFVGDDGTTKPWAYVPYVYPHPLAQLD